MVKTVIQNEKICESNTFDHSFGRTMRVDTIMLYSRRSFVRGSWAALSIDSYDGPN